jgi:hypothetical protein
MNAETLTRLYEAGVVYEAAYKTAERMPREARYGAHLAASAALKDAVAALRICGSDLIPLVQGVAAVCDYEAGVCSDLYMEGWEERAAWERADAALSQAVEHIDDATREPISFTDHALDIGHPHRGLAA